MFNSVQLNEILTSFIGGLVALFFAGFVWIIKSAYTKHKQEMLALAKLERATALNFEALIDNSEFIEKWINSSVEKRAFSCDFTKYILLEEETYNLSNLKIINEILPVLYRLDRSNKDLENMYKGYWDAIYKIDLIENEGLKNSNLEVLFSNIKTQLEVIAPNYDILQNNLKSVIAHIRANSKVRKYSLFGIVDYLFKDIYPRVNDELVIKEQKKLEEEISKKRKR